MFDGEFALSGMPSEVAALIDQAGLGLSSWLDVSRLIVEFLPDAFCWINNQHRKTGNLNFAAISGLADEAVSAYENHFCTVNPFNGVWDKFRPGEVISSEATIPFEVFRKTEFYNEFLGKSGDFEMGLGVKIDATDLDRFVMPIHFPLVMREAYEPVVRNLFSSIGGNLSRAAEINRLHAETLTGVISAAALTGRSQEVAFVVDFGLRPVEANLKAAEAFAAADLLTVRHGRIRVKHSSTDVWLKSTVTSMICGLPVANAKHVCETESDAWLFSVYRVPENDPRNVNRFFGVRQLALVTLSNLRKAEPSAANEILGRHFNLTPAEEKLCGLLLKGHALKECADLLGISIETVRDRTKVLFQKTGTSRQSELISLLVRAR